MSAFSPPHPVPPLLLVWGDVKLPKGPRSPSLLTLIAIQGTPEHLRFDESLEGGTEFRTAVKLTVAVYYSELMQIKISQEKTCTGQRPGKLHTRGFQLSPPSGVVDIVNSLAMLADKTHGVLPTWEAPFRLGVHRLYWGRHGGMTDHPHSWP